MDPRRLLAVVFFLGFAADQRTVYAAEWFAPLGLFDWLFEAPPYKIRLFDHFTIYCLYKTYKKGGWVNQVNKPMRKALYASVASLVLGLAYGILRGGSAWAGSWQVYLMASGVLFAFSAASVYRTPADFAYLEKAMFAAALYRAVMCWLFYIFYIRSSTKWPGPEFLTTHDDTVVWVTVVLVLIERMLSEKKFSRRIKPALITGFFLGAILFNQRRLAWVSLAMGGMVMFALIQGAARKRAIRGALALVPVIAIYVIVGWGRPEKIFKPLKSFATVSTEEDASTKARNAENMGLITSSNMSSILVGTGWGHPYYEYTNKYTIAHLFPLWQFVPHNSILALLAFSGGLGFFAYWLPFPTAMFLNGRVARLSKDPAARRLGLIGAFQAVACANQYYGDMGSYFTKSVYVLALSYAYALNLPGSSNLWVKPKARPAANTPPPPIPPPTSGV